MLFKQLVGLMATFAAAEAYTKGFNSGNVLTNGQPKTYSDFAAEFKRAQNLPGTSGWNSFRLYTNIQAGTAATPISAFQAAIDTGTELLLGLWASAGQEAINNEIAALQSAITQYGSKFTDLVVGISVGSEDLYRDSVVGIENNAGVGAGPETIASYIAQTKKALQGTALSSSPIGHVDTWPAWANSSNSAVVQAVQWAGMDAYPYFQYQNPNSISNAKSLFFSALQTTKNAVGGKNVWITETGWPVSGKTVGEAVPSIANAETYWQEVSCEIQGNYNVWWYTLQDAEPAIPNPSFGIIGPDLNSAPYYDLSCNGSSSSSASSSATASSSAGAQAATSASSTDLTSYTVSATASAATVSASAATAPYSGNATSPSVGAGASGVGGGAYPTLGGLNTATNSMSASMSASSAYGAPAQQTGNSAAKIGSAMGAGLLAAFGLAAAL